jgi:hypothetical protein
MAVIVVSPSRVAAGRLFLTRPAWTTTKAGRLSRISKLSQIQGHHSKIDAISIYDTPPCFFNETSRNGIEEMGLEAAASDFSLRTWRNG